MFLAFFLPTLSAVAQFHDALDSLSPVLHAMSLAFLRPSDAGALPFRVSSTIVWMSFTFCVVAILMCLCRSRRTAMPSRRRMRSSAWPRPTGNSADGVLAGPRLRAPPAKQAKGTLIIYIYTHHYKVPPLPSPPRPRCACVWHTAALIDAAVPACPPHGASQWGQQRCAACSAPGGVIFAANIATSTGTTTSRSHPRIGVR